MFLKATFKKSKKIINLYHILIILSTGFPKVLHEVDLRIQDNDHCERQFNDAGLFDDLTKSVLICAGAGAEGGKDSCQVNIRVILGYFVCVLLFSINRNYSLEKFSCNNDLHQRLKYSQIEAHSWSLIVKKSHEISYFCFKEAASGSAV